MLIIGCSMVPWFHGSTWCAMGMKTLRASSRVRRLAADILGPVSFDPVLSRKQRGFFQEIAFGRRKTI